MQELLIFLRNDFSNILGILTMIFCPTIIIYSYFMDIDKINKNTKSRNSVNNNKTKKKESFNVKIK